MKTSLNLYKSDFIQHGYLLFSVPPMNCIPEAPPPYCTLLAIKAKKVNDNLSDPGLHARWTHCMSFTVVLGCLLLLYLFVCLIL